MTADEIVQQALGNIADAAEIPVTAEMIAGCEAAWTEAMKEPLMFLPYESVSISPTSDMPTYYDVSYDERRPITQEIVDNMERGIQRLIAERDEIRSDKAPDALLVADRNARVRERDEARAEATNWCRRYAERGTEIDSLRAELIAAPVELISDGERIWHTRALIAEGRVAELEGKDERDEVAKERNAMIASLLRSGAAQHDEIAMLRQALAMKDARIAQLDTRLASTPVAFEDPDAKPEPEHNPFRHFPRDMRRMGP